MNALWRFVQAPKNRAILSWAGGGVVVAAGALWAVITFLYPDHKDARPTDQTVACAQGGSIATGHDASNNTVSVTNSGGRIGRERGLDQVRCAGLVALGLLLALAAGAQPARAPGDTSATATDCSIAAGRDASNNSITCTYGLTPEQVKELTEAAARGATAPLAAMIVDLSKTLGVTEDATRTLLRIVGEQEVPIERLSETLSKVANDYKRLQAQVAALNPDNPTARGLVERARAAIDDGRFAEAHQLLAEARQAQVVAAEQARQLREQAQAAEDAQLLGAAASAATEGGLTLTEGRYLDAAELFKQAAQLVPPGHPGENAEYLWRQADALYRQGDERGDNGALDTSIATFRVLLRSYPRERVPLDWATAQMNLGTALERLGERESGTARLEEAVAAFRTALEELTRERVPLEWAYSQHGLAETLASLALRQHSAARMTEALACIRGAINVYEQTGESYSLPVARRRAGEMEAALVDLKR